MKKWQRKGTEFYGLLTNWQDYYDTFFMGLSLFSGSTFSALELTNVCVCVCVAETRVNVFWIFLFLVWFVWMGGI